jgi:hypothetical protein
MRLALLLPVLFSVAFPAYAEGVRESRYGPTTPRQASVAAAAARYDGPMLGWASKRQAPTEVAAPATSAPAQPAPLAARTVYNTTPAAPAQALPTSLYAAPRPATAVAATPVAAKDWSSYRSSRMTGVAPASTPVSAPASAPAQPRQIAAATGGGTARFYSVDRDYGLTPDAVPPAGPDNRVLVTATEPPPEPKDATPIHGSADWLAAGVSGNDDDNDDSATRRAKTRNQDQ